MTQLKKARAGVITEQMKITARAENIRPEDLRDLIKKGQVVLLSNRLRWENHKGLPQKVICGVGKRLRTKVNANIGTSTDYCNIQNEVNKLKIACGAGADTVMDLSSAGNISHIRRILLSKSPVAFGTVPIYEASLHHLSGAKNKEHIHRSILKLTAEDIFKTIENHCRDGVDFITVHCGVTRDVVSILNTDGRVGGMVSRGGTIMAEWMKMHQRENPLYEHFDRLLEIAREYDVVLSLGDGLRPGAICDAFDRVQIAELMVLAELARRARKADVQVIIEGPGHVPLNQIQAQVQLEKTLCDEAPFYVLGPLVLDSAPGYDHITSAIGAAVAGWAGADFICYVTPSEHLGLPTAEDVREGVIAARIAAQAADVAKGNPASLSHNKTFSEYRRQCDWEKQIKLAIDPEKAKHYRKRRKTKSRTACSMCGEICVYNIVRSREFGVGPYGRTPNSKLRTNLYDYTHRRSSVGR
ncbi:MAG: phosphomethylpyrimidine synthase ThiC [Planctomycetota bacterium]|nr:phosphomethylpyrimidine synthase ThiC [Planctomycetota bacterium]MDI6786969.1 phosphomethylpyrimidine synthase ThiC [Planctomycetota bacterium]